jgi:hypothetical protein
MASRGMIMRTSDNVAAKRTRVRDIDLILVGKEASVDLPIREARMEGRGNGTIKGLKGIPDKDIVTKRGVNEIVQGSVDDPDKERWGEESDILIVRRDGKLVWSARKGVWAGECRSGDMGNPKIKVSEVKKPMGLTTVQVLWTVKEGEVFVICKSLDRERGTVKVLTPGFEGTDNGK